MVERYEMVMNIPSPYRLHLFKELHRQMAIRRVDFHVHFMAHGHAERPKSWLNPHIETPHTYWRDLGILQFHFNPGLIWRLIRNPPEWLDLGNPYDNFTCVLLALFCKAKHVVMGLEGNTKTPGKLDGFVGWFKRLILSRATNFYAPGSDGVKFFDLHRMRTVRKLAPCALLPNVIEESRFHTRDEFCRMGAADRINDIRQRMVGPSDCVARVCVIPARLEPVKGLVPFINLLTPTIVHGWKIVILGQGPLKMAIVDLIKSRGLTENVVIFDYVPYEDMPLFYAASDLALLPSVYDPNPLTSVEALHSGLPLALSCMAGNVEEAVTDGANGWVLPVSDCAEFDKKLHAVFSTPIEKLREMGRVSKIVNAQYWNTCKAVGRLLDEMKVGLNEPCHSIQMEPGEGVEPPSASN